MKKNRLITSVAAFVALTTVYATAYVAVSHNALNRGPSINAEFQKHSAEEMKAAERATMEAAGHEPSDRIRKAPDGTPLPAIVASVFDYSNATIGMYRLPEVSGGEMEKVSDVSSYYGGALKGNLFYACHDGRYADYWDTDNDPHGHKLQAYDITTWEKQGPELYLDPYRAFDLAINPKDGKGYAFCDYGSMMYHLYSIDLETGAQTDLTPGVSFLSGEYSRALAFNEDGVLYGVTRNGYFGVVDMTTGKNSSIAKVGGDGDMQHGVSATFDPESGNFVYMYNGTENSGAKHVSKLYSINPATGESTLLAEFTDKCMTSIYIVPTVIADEAPGVVDNISGIFVNGALSGTLKFTMPSTLHNGAAASGTANWTVYDGSDKVAEGTSSYGAEVTANVTVATAGKHNFSVAASNDTGEGKRSRLQMWVGPDIPVAPENIKVIFDESTNTFTVSWDAVTKGANDGYLDASAVTYSVVRMPGEVTVAENITATTVTNFYEPQGIESITFRVVAMHAGNSSEEAVSSPTVTGSLALPYDIATLDKYSILDNWTVDDVNDDGYTWDDGYNGLNYSYHSSNKADDWAITPPIKAVAGARYKVHVAFACQMTSCPEKVEMKYGYSPTAGGMTEELMHETVIDQTSAMPFELEICPDRNGTLFIGFHAMSDANMYKLKVIEFTVSAPVSDVAPAAPEIVEALADRSGALSLKGKVKLPAETANGDALSSLSRVEIMRNGTIIATIDNPVPGSTVEFVDDKLSQGAECIYTAFAYSGEAKSGPSNEFKTYVGINRPGSVGGITIRRDPDNAAGIIVSWDAAAVDWQGYPLNGEVSYNLEVFPDNAYYHGNKTYEGISETSYKLTPTFETGRDCGFVYVKIYGVNSAGIGYGEKSENIFAGEPLKLPFKESFPNYTLDNPWGDGKSNGPQIASITDDERAVAMRQYNGWNRMMDASFQNSEGSQDGDNGFAGMFGWSYVNDSEGNYFNEWTELISPAIDLSGAKRPTLTFYTYNWFKNNFSNINHLDIDVVTADGTRHNARSLVIGELGKVEAWEHVAVDLSDYAGQVVSLIFKGTIYSQNDNGYNWVLIDNIRIDQLPDTDLGIADIEAPVEAKPGEPFAVKARVSNLGAKDVASYRAILYHNGTEVASKDFDGLAFSRSETIEFSHSLSVQDPVGNSFKIKVVAEGDEKDENNETGEVTVARNMRLLPEPGDVVITADGSRLSWAEPDYSNAVPEMVLDDFESYTIELEGNFLTSAGDWVFVDVDKAPIGGMVSASSMEMIEFPGIPVHSAQSWWVQTRLVEAFNDSYYGHDMSMQYLANMYVVNESFNKAVQQDDWAISPELCGREQLVTLWARSYNRDTPETIEFLYSDGSLTPGDFKLIRRIEQLPGDWTQYALVVPEGARRFAIRGCSYASGGTAQTFIDDVAFYPASGDAQKLNLLGYNVYSGNRLLTTSPIKDLSFAELPAEHKDFAVSAVYVTGESRAVAATVEGGIDNLSAIGVKIKVRKGGITVLGATGQTCNVFSVSGISVASSVCTGSTDIPLGPGIYIVAVGTNVAKVVVR